METLPLWRGVDLLEATSVTQNLSRYFAKDLQRGHFGGSHGVRLCEEVTCGSSRGQAWVPGEAYGGHAADENGWSYSMMCLNSHQLKKTAEAVGAFGFLPHFHMGVLDAPSLAVAFMLFLFGMIWFLLPGLWGITAANFVYVPALVWWSVVYSLSPSL